MKLLLIASLLALSVADELELQPAPVPENLPDSGTEKLQNDAPYQQFLPKQMRNNPNQIPDLSDQNYLNPQNYNPQQWLQQGQNVWNQAQNLIPQGQNQWGQYISQGFGQLPNLTPSGQNIPGQLTQWPSGQNYIPQNIVPQGQQPWNPQNFLPGGSQYKPPQIFNQNQPGSQVPSIPPIGVQNDYQPSPPTTSPISIIKNENTQNGDGSYKYEWETGDKTHVGEIGYPVNQGTENESLVKKGFYSYVGADGKTYTVTYWADDTGFHAFGDHLPTPPPVPPAIQAALDQNAKEEAEEEARKKPGYQPPQGAYRPSPPEQSYIPAQNSPPSHDEPKNRPPSVPPHQQYYPPQQQHNPPRPEFNPPQHSHNPPQQQYNPPQQQYNPPQQQYNPPQQHYNPPQQQYYPPQQSYNPPQQTHIPAPPSYNPSQQSYKPPQQTYPYVRPEQPNRPSF